MALIFQIELWCHAKLMVDRMSLHSDIEEKNIQQYNQTLQPILANGSFISF
jgi:hypothetical protein